MNQHIIYPS